MLSQMASDHANSRNRENSKRDKAKKHLIRSGKNLSLILLDSINKDVETVVQNQNQIEKQVDTLYQNSVTFQNQTNNWLNILNSLNHELKSLGDVEEWSNNVEHDMKTMATSLHYVYSMTTEKADAQQAQMEQEKAKLQMVKNKT